MTAVFTALWHGCASSAKRDEYLRTCSDMYDENGVLFFRHWYRGVGLPQGYKDWYLAEVRRRYDRGDYTSDIDHWLVLGMGSAEHILSGYGKRDVYHCDACDRYYDKPAYPLRPNETREDREANRGEGGNGLRGTCGTCASKGKYIYIYIETLPPQPARVSPVPYAHNAPRWLTILTLPAPAVIPFCGGIPREVIR